VVAFLLLELFRLLVSFMGDVGSGFSGDHSGSTCAAFPRCMRRAVHEAMADICSECLLPIATFNLGFRRIMQRHNKVMKLTGPMLSVRLHGDFNRTAVDLRLALLLINIGWLIALAFSDGTWLYWRGSWHCHSICTVIGLAVWLRQVSLRPRSILAPKCLLIMTK